MSQTPNLSGLAKEYEEDLRYLIYQLSSGDYESAIDSFFILTDLFCLIQRLEKLEQCQVNVLPPASIMNPETLEKLNVDPAEKRKVRDFLQYIERNKGINFEQLISAHMKDRECGDPNQTKARVASA